MLAGLILAFAVLLASASAWAVSAAEQNATCLAVPRRQEHDRPSTDGKVVSLFVDGKKFTPSVHGSVGCTGCHADLEGKDLPHPTPAKVNCGTCHSQEQDLYSKSLHGKAAAHGDALAPHCVNCHGNHDIVPVKDKRSAVAPLRIPFVCGSCHQEGTPVQRPAISPQHDISANYTESIHGEGVLKMGLTVSATCVSCHTAHSILPHTDPNSSIARRNIAATCTQCHAQIETVHRRRSAANCGRKRPTSSPPAWIATSRTRCATSFTTMAWPTRTACVATPIRTSRPGMAARCAVNAPEIAGSRHAKIACSQCHSEVTGFARPALRDDHPQGRLLEVPRRRRRGLRTQHPWPAHRQERSRRAELQRLSRNARHPGKTRTRNRRPSRPIFPPFAAGVTAEGKKAALRYTGTQHNIIQNYTESIHGKGLLESGLTVTATCTSCHTAHRILPAKDPDSTVNPKNVPSTCGKCHNGIEAQFVNSVHSPTVTTSDKALPVCSTCHTAHTITRTDDTGFELGIMNTCGKCHAEITKTYFETYHGKVSRLGYTKAAKCYDCHGSHDIANVNDPRSHLSRANVVATCRKCHSSATRRFAGYLTHATHHDPKKYPILFFAFWAMTGLLVGTFVVGGLHTVLWLPRAFQMRRELKQAEAEEEAALRAEARKRNRRVRRRGGNSNDEPKSGGAK